MTETIETTETPTEAATETTVEPTEVDPSIEVMETIDFEDEDEPTPEPTDEPTGEPEPEPEPKEPVPQTPDEKIAAVKDKAAKIKEDAKVEAEPELEESKVEPEPVKEVKVVEPVEPQKTPEEMRKGLVEEITGRYKLSEDEAGLMATDPAAVIPNLAGRLFVDIYEAVFHGIMSQMPRVVQTMQTQTASNSEKEKAFYDSFPELKDPKLIPQLAEIGAFFRKTHPDATSEQMIEGVGNMAMTMLNIERAAPEKEPVALAPKVIPPSTPSAAKSGGGEDPPPIDKVSKDILDAIDFEYPDE